MRQKLATIASLLFATINITTTGVLADVERGMDTKGTIPRRQWIDSSTKARAVMLCIHGLGLNSDSWDDFASRMAKRGIRVYAIDVRGFGEWMQQNGHAKIDFKKCFDDIAVTLTELRTQYRGLPVFLTGESMGGSITLQVAAMHPELINALLCSVPAGSRDKEVRTDVKTALHALEGPRKDFAEGKQVIDMATKDAALREAWQTDPLDRMDLSPLDLLQFQELCDGDSDAAKKLNPSLPVLVVEGNKDKLIKPKGTFELFSKMSSTHRFLLVVGNSEHLVFELEQFGHPDDNIELVWTWMQQAISMANEPDR